MKKLAVLLIALMALLPQLAWANKADILMLPTRVVMEKNDRFATVILRNIGNATGNLSVDLVDMAMGEDGSVLALPPGKTDPFSAIPYLRVSPRSIQMKPGEAQTLRIMLRKPEGLAAGEYRSHLKIKIDDDDVEATTAANQAKDSSKATGIAVKAKLAFTIPVIFRVGDTNVSVKINSPQIIHDAQGKPAIHMILLHTGNRSVLGDFTFTYTPPGGTPRLIKTFPGIPVYRLTDRREVTISLNDIPADVNLNKGTLEIAYTAQKSEGGMKLDDTTITLGAH